MVWGQRAQSEAPGKDITQRAAKLCCSTVVQLSQAVRAPSYVGRNSTRASELESGALVHASSI